MFMVSFDKMVLVINGDIVIVNLCVGIVDKFGDCIVFGKCVVELVGVDMSKFVGNFNVICYDVWVKVNLILIGGDVIGVLMIVGEIVDGVVGFGSVVGKMIEKVMFDGLVKKNLKVFVVWVDLLGGLVLVLE